MAESLTSQEKDYLLQLARQTIECRLENAPTPKPNTDELSPPLRDDGAAFVTLHMRGTLRGCIGNILPAEPLVLNVIHNALNAAFSDPRFNPLQPREMEYIDIEISLLTSPTPITTLDDFIVGRHGIILERGRERAVFLPQVAPEQGWDKETTLNHLAMKAGLTPDAWRHDDVTFKVFEAIVFGEE